ncbi:ML domain-containing protein [Mycena galopus ATCC 62051]|nr:ML domain-containing protein [Mycena galopus ATCC 62051]
MLARPFTFLLFAAFACFVAALPGQPQVALTQNVRLAGDNWDYVNCGQSSDSVQIQSISVSPDPPKIGAELTVTVDVDVIETVEDGATADVLVKVGRIKLLQKTFDICEEARKANASVTCPVEPGSYTIVQTVELPKEVPKMKYVINVRGYTKDEDDMACVDLTVQWRPFFQLWE